MCEEFGGICGEGGEEINLSGDIREAFAAGLEEVGDGEGIERTTTGRPYINPREGDLVKFFGGHCTDIFAAEPCEFCLIEDGRGFGDATYIEFLYEFIEGEFFVLLIGGAPAEQGDIIDDCFLDIAFIDEILIGGIAITFGEFSAGIPHNGRDVDISGHFPAEGFIEQVIFGGGGEIFVATDYVRDCHEVIIDDIGEIIGGEAIGFEEDLIIERDIFDGYTAKDSIVERGCA